MKAFLQTGQAIVHCLWLPITLLVLAAITTLSLTPLPDLPDVPGNDKAHHLISYAILILPAFTVSYVKRVPLLLFFFAWSGAIELIQPYVNRYGEWADVAANGVGLLVGAGLGFVLSKFVMSRFPANQTSE